MPDTLNFKIEGGKKLKGSVEIKKSKNAAVAVLCASLLNECQTTLKKIPRIEEVFRIIEVLQSIGVDAYWQGKDCSTRERAETNSSTPPPHRSCQK